MAFNPPQKKKSIWDTLGGVASGVAHTIGSGVDAVIPGDQSFLHGGSTGVATPARPTPAVAAPNPIVRSINRSAGINPAGIVTPTDSVMARPAVDMNTVKPAKPSVVSVLRKSVQNNDVVRGLEATGQAIEQPVVDKAKEFGTAIAKPYQYFGHAVVNAVNELSPAGKAKHEADLRLSDQYNHDLAYANQKMFDPNTTPEQKVRWKQFFDKTKAQSDAHYNQMAQETKDFMAATDPTKTAASGASIVTDILTAGQGEGAVQAAKQAAKSGKGALAKELLKQGAETGGTAAVSGGLYPVVQEGKDATAGEIATGASIGFGAGMVLPGAGYIVDKYGRKILGKTADQVAEDATLAGGATEARPATEVAQQAEQAAANTAADQATRPVPNVHVSEDLKNTRGVDPTVHSVKSDAITLGSDTLGSDISKQTVKDYIKKIANGEVIDPLVVSRDEAGNVLLQDGKHRLEAMKALGITDIPVVERDMAKPAPTAAEQAIKDAAPDAQGNTVHRDKNGEVALVTNQKGEIVYQNPDLTPAQPVTTMQHNESVPPTVDSSPAAIEPVAPGEQVAPVPNGQEVIDRTTARADEAANAGRQSTGKKAIDTAKRTLGDPYADLQRADYAEAKAQGIKYENLPMSQRLTHLKGRATNIKNEVKKILDIRHGIQLPDGRTVGISMTDIIKKYGSGTKAEKEFMTYANLRFDREFRALHNGAALDPHLSDAELEAAISAYEGKNPAATYEVNALKAYGDNLLDYGVAMHVIDAAEADYVKSVYKNYVPIERVLSDNLPEIKISGGIRNSVGQQKFLRELRGDGTKPLNTSFSTLIDRAHMAVRQGRTNMFDMEMLRRAQAGREGWRVAVDPEMVQAKKELVDKLKEVRSTIKSLRSAQRQATTKKRVARAYAASAQREGAAAMKQSLIEGIKSEDAKVRADAVRKLNRLLVRAGRSKEQLKFVRNVTRSAAKGQARAELGKLTKMATSDSKQYVRDFIKTATDRINSLDDKALAERSSRMARVIDRTQEVNDLVEQARQTISELVSSPELKQTVKTMDRQQILSILGDNAETPGLKTVSRRTANATERYQNAAGAVDQIKQEIADAQAQREDLFTAQSGIQIDKTSNMAVVKGQRDGTPFAVEIPMDIANGLAQLSKDAGREWIDTVAHTPANIFKMLFTGAAAPIFTIVNAFVKNPVLMYHNAKGVTPFGIRAIGQGIASLKFNNAFQQRLIEAGYNRVNATMSVQDQKLVGAVIASRGGIKNYAQFMVTHPVMSAKDAFNHLNTLGAAVENMQRSQIAAGLYYSLRRQGVPEEEAIQKGAEAANEVLGNFQRVTQAARAAEPLLLYSGATQAGARAVGHAYRVRPIESALKLGSLVIGAGTAFSAALSAPEGMAYIQDMVDSGRQSTLDGSIFFVLPGASKDDKTGEWTGIIKIPIAPDFRPVNHAVWSNLLAHANGDGVDPASFGMAALGFFTGDIYHTANDQQAGILGGNPVVQTSKTLMNVDPNSGIGGSNPTKPLVDAAMARKPNEDQVYPTTSDAAIAMADKLGITPIEADKILSAGGFLGQMIQGKKGPTEALASQFQGGKGQTDSSKFFNKLDEIGKALPNDGDYQAFMEIHSPKDTSEGTVTNQLDKEAEKWKTLLARPDVLGAEAQLDQYNRDNGQPGNPFFDLSPEQQQAVMRYRAAKDLNAGKQTYDKNGMPLFTALGLDDKWYQDFRDSEGKFYDQVKQLNADQGSVASKTPSPFMTYSGAAPAPTPDTALQAKLDTYYAMPKGGTRSAFLKQNPDILDYWAQENSFTKEERVALGLKAEQDYAASGGRYGGGGGGGKVSVSFGSMNSKPASNTVKAPKRTVTVKARKAASKKVVVKRGKMA